MNSEGSKYPGLRPLPPDFVRDYPPLALVVEEKCIACDRMSPLCFFDAIVMEARPRHKFKRTAIVIPDNCTGCGLCFEACLSMRSYGSLTRILRRVPPRPLKKPKEIWAYEDCRSDTPNQ